LQVASFYKNFCAFLIGNTTSAALFWFEIGQLLHILVLIWQLLHTFELLGEIGQLLYFYRLKIVRRYTLLIFWVKRQLLLISGLKDGKRYTLLNFWF
jgi:hypothetical protein